MAPKEPSLPKRSFFGDRYETATRDNIKNDFDYEPKGDILGTERPATPKIPKLDSSINRKILLSNIKDSGRFLYRIYLFHLYSSSELCTSLSFW